MRTQRETALYGRAKTSGAVWFLNQGWIALFRCYAALNNTRRSGTTPSECTRRLVAKPQARRHIGEMRPLLLSGLLCVPAVVMLYFSWPHDRGGRLEDATVAPAPMSAVSQSSTLTVSLPPRSQREPPQMDSDAWAAGGGRQPHS